MKKLTPLIIGAILIVTVAVVVVTTIKLKKHDVVEGKYKNMAGAVYVGSAECKKCHERKFLDWTTTLHSKMMQDAKTNPQAILGDFTSTSQIRSFEKKDIDFVLGNKWKQQYLKKEGSDYTVLPASYNLTKNKWEPYHPNNPQKRSWFKECAGCHATGVDTAKRTFHEPGIGCEACHGPGSNHIKAIPGYEIATIVNPARLTADASAQICGSCHGRGLDRSGHYPYPIDYLTSRGTVNLHLHFQLANPKDNPELFWPSGEGRYNYMQYNDWRQSVHASVGITCTDCHNVHKRETQAQTKQTADNLCKNCHTTLEYRAAHRIHTFGSCIACHMPKVASSVETGADMHSHTFKFISPKLSIQMGGLKAQPNSCNSCHYHKNTPMLDLYEFLEAARKSDMPLPVSAHRRPARDLRDLIKDSK